MQDGYVPPECVGGLLPWKKGSWARCSSKYAFRASVRCNNGYYYFGPWLNPGNRTSYAYCPSGTIATNWYVDIPE
ncbi:hypothetical protein [Nocardiopsis halophila]|uniref:hypothetical protein n=1 Tax=Nocardiopsis halophila TaxID=141692 RepID=UPI00037400A5|nr:hypothetical protein [Nocardiopsis halophila]